MNILVTGAAGMVGTALIANLKTLQDGRNRTRPQLHIEKIYAYDRGDEARLDEFCQDCDFVFHLAGVNRPPTADAFMQDNCAFTSLLLETLKKHRSRATVMLSSSIQAACIGRYDGPYGRSKLAAETLLRRYAAETGVKTVIYRFPNLMGHSRPRYNSFVSTLCYCVANDEPYTVRDRSEELELLCMDDLIEGMYDLLEGKEKHCTFDGVKPVERADGEYGYVPGAYRVTLGEIVDRLEEFRAQPTDLRMPQMPDGSFAKKLFSLYLSYLPADKCRYPLTMHTDDRGSFTELMRTADCGQVSVNVARPGVVKGQHWHNSKWEQFIVVAGHGLIRERNIHTGEMLEFEVSGDTMEAVYMIPGWTHSLINLSDTENLVTVMLCNEIFDPDRPDTFFEKV